MGTGKNEPALPATLSICISCLQREKQTPIFPRLHFIVALWSNWCNEKLMMRLSAVALFICPLPTACIRVHQKKICHVDPTLQTKAVAFFPYLGNHLREIKCSYTLSQHRVSCCAEQQIQWQVGWTFTAYGKLRLTKHRERIKCMEQMIFIPFFPHCWQFPQIICGFRTLTRHHRWLAIILGLRPSYSPLFHAVLRQARHTCLMP